MVVFDRIVCYIKGDWNDSARPVGPACIRLHSGTVHSSPVFGIMYGGRLGFPRLFGIMVSAYRETTEGDVRTGRPVVFVWMEDWKEKKEEKDEEERRCRPGPPGG